MLLLKITLYVLLIIVLLFMFAIFFAAGLMRGLKIMSTKELKRSSFEDNIVKKVFEGNDNIDPFFYSIYLKEKRQQESDAWKHEVRTLKKQIADNLIVSDKIKKKKTSGKKSK